MEKNTNDMENKDMKGGSQQEVNSKYEELKKDAEQEKGEKKPGSQSNHSSQHNNGRGGGK